MEYSKVITIICLIFVGDSRGQAADFQTFPDGFLIGAASASYQIEGAWNVSGKGESVWDYAFHNMLKQVSDDSNGDIACDSYHKYKEDVQWIRDIGFDHYRLSLSWPRILPNGSKDRVNLDGIRYYRNLLEELKAANVTTVVSLYHWDHPEVLEEIGGWTNEVMVERFEDYAKVVFDNLGYLVDIFVTINEPEMLCFDEPVNSSEATARGLANDVASYLCVHNALKAHAKVWHMYDENYRATQGGIIGLLPVCRGWVSGDGVTEESIERYFQFGCGLVLHPIYKGDYSEIVKTTLADIDVYRNRSFSSLPVFTDEWVKMIKGTNDYFGLNHYTSRIPVMEYGARTSDSGVLEIRDKSWPITVLDRLEVVPEGFGNLLRKIRDEYDNPPVYILENGFADSGEILDYGRINYHYDYLSELLTAIIHDGCNVKAYTIWSLLDNFEWDRGYSISFGIVKVDFTSPNRTRSEKLSTRWWKEVIRTRTLIKPPAPGSTSSWGGCFECDLTNDKS
ncbi:myrosinase 1-like [Athalia rosae]|uniref:myrosinase 1-like n=1 Tax=Athalia rosae TaxID=37344 RepID=UPI0020343B75|nr:myrosinase 1-like [Athalia rosae]